MEHINHFPGVRMWWKAIENIKRPILSGLRPETLQGLEEWEMVKTADPQSLLRAMDKYGVDVACLLPESMMDTTGYTSRWCSNGEMAAVVESNPDRFMYQPNLSPIKHKGVKNTVWELEYWVQGKRGQNLQVLSAGGHLHQRSRTLAVLPQGRGTGHRSGYPHRFLLGAAGQRANTPCPY